MQWLSQNEVNDLCCPLKQFAAQMRFLRGLGICVYQKPSGAPLVLRTQVEQKMSFETKSPIHQVKVKPNRLALIQQLGKS